MSTADGRDTKLELVELRQEANGYTVKVQQRGVFTQAFEIPKLVENTKFTDEEHALLVQAFTIIERASFETYEEVMVSPEEAQKRVLAADRANKAAAEAKAAAEKAEADRIAAERRSDEADTRTVTAQTVLMSLEERQQNILSQIEEAAKTLGELREQTVAARIAREITIAEKAAAETKPSEPETEPT